MLSETSVRERYLEKMRNQPQEIVFCRHCLISNQRPRIRFDVLGVCSACRFAETKARAIDWPARAEQFRDVLDRHRSHDGSYDVIVPCSGGKDSSMVAHQLKYKYGMHPLTVTFAPLIYTENGRGNHDRFIASGFDNVMFTPDRSVYRRLCRLGFEVIGDPFQPFIYGVKAFPPMVAVERGIPLIMYAENGEVEYGGDEKNANSPTHDLEGDLAKHYFSGVLPEDWSTFGLRPAELRPFVPPEARRLHNLGVECYFFGYFHKWVPQENYYYAAQHTGFQANSDGRSEGTYSKYASLDDRVDGFHYYMAFIKFGIGRATSDAAHEIRDGHLTREEGVSLVRRYDGEFPRKYFQDFLKYTELSEQRFYEIVDDFRLPHVWERTNGSWRLRRQVE